MPREKVTPEEKAMAAKDCAEGHLSQTEAARRLGVDIPTHIHCFTATEDFNTPIADSARSWKKRA